MMEWGDVSLYPLNKQSISQPLTFFFDADGFFDAGMLLHALKELSGRESRREKPVKKRLVGKMLKLNEY